MAWSFEVEGIEEFEAAIIKAQGEIAPMAELAMWDSVRLLEGEAKAAVPRKTGRLAASIGAGVRNEGATIIGEVGTNVEYAWPIETGQRPHFIAGREISPITGKTKLLKFELGGQTWFKQWVYHTGARAYEFLSGSLEKSEELIVERFKVVQNHVMDILKD